MLLIMCAFVGVSFFRIRIFLCFQLELPTSGDESELLLQIIFPFGCWR